MICSQPQSFNLWGSAKSISNWYKNYRCFQLFEFFLLLLPFLPARGIQHPNTRKWQSDWTCEWFQCLFHEETAQQMRAKLWQMHERDSEHASLCHFVHHFQLNILRKLATWACLVSHGFHSEQQSLLNVGNGAFIVTLLPQPQAESTQLSNHLRTKATHILMVKPKQRRHAETTAACQNALLSSALDLNKWKSTRRTQDLKPSWHIKSPLPLGKKLLCHFQLSNYTKWEAF